MKFSKLAINATLSLGMALGFTSCVMSVGDFTVASSNNVRNLNYSAEDKTKIKTEGYACARKIFFFSINQQDNLLKRAMDDTIENGQKKGVDGDLLVNVRITFETTTFIIYNDHCFVVKGDLIKIKDGGDGTYNTYNTYNNAVSPENISTTVPVSQNNTNTVPVSPVYTENTNPVYTDNTNTENTVETENTNTEYPVYTEDTNTGDTNTENPVETENAP
jgi:hypothetical protein